MAPGWAEQKVLGPRAGRWAIPRGLVRNIQATDALWAAAGPTPHGKTGGLQEQARWVQTSLTRALGQKKRPDDL